MREVKLEDCKVGMALKLKEDCPFREYWEVDSKAFPIMCEVISIGPDYICTKFQVCKHWKGPVTWYFYIDGSSIIADDYELISLNLEYATKRKNNYY